MTIDQYFEFVAGRIRNAQNAGNREEVIRLIRLVRDTCDDKLKELGE